MKRKFRDGTEMPRDKAVLYALAEEFNWTSSVNVNGMISFFDVDGELINTMHCSQWLDIARKAMRTQARGYGRE